MSPAQSRRAAILAILEHEEVASQAVLLERLAQLGFETTQPALSRDLRALEVAKRGGVYQLVVEEHVTQLQHLRMLLRDARPAGEHLVVVVTEPGAASAVARALEAEELEGLVGTVAGDDTVFVAVADAAASSQLVERVRSSLS